MKQTYVRGTSLRLISEPAELAAFCRERKQRGETIGFVPTMGALHEGHASLFREAVAQSDCTIISVFVNPAQFGDPDDYQYYPRDLAHDRLVAEHAGVTVLFCPSAETMYPEGTSVSAHVAAKTDVLCGQSRPGHFDGVVTILTKLFALIQPDCVFFGMKDAQQVAIVDDLLHSFLFPIKLVACPIVREADGLARSSRNARLTTEERSEAPHVSRGLQAGLEAVRDGCREAAAIGQTVKDYYQQHLTIGRVDYVDVLTYPGLTSPPDGMVTGRFIIASAVYYSKARLIDNVTEHCPASV
ncbi:MAG: pantoate--beta-alanine ligase [Sporolactobacillus sp.]